MESESITDRVLVFSGVNQFKLLRTALGILKHRCSFFPHLEKFMGHRIAYRHPHDTIHATKLRAREHSLDRRKFNSQGIPGFSCVSSLANASEFARNLMGSDPKMLVLDSVNEGNTSTLRANLNPSFL